MTVMQHSVSNTVDHNATPHYKRVMHHAMHYTLLTHSTLITSHPESLRVKFH
jgi:hypothetical protein